MKLHQVQLLPRVPIILKDLYDSDLLEEDVIFAWAEKVGVCEGAQHLNRSVVFSLQLHRSVPDMS